VSIEELFGIGMGVIIIGFVLGVVVNLGLWLFNVGC